MRSRGERQRRCKRTSTGKPRRRKKKNGTGGNKIQGMYETTRKKVEDKLNAMDGEINRIFDDGEKITRDRFESYVDAKCSDYKWDRYLAFQLWGRSVA